MNGICLNFCSQLSVAILGKIFTLVLVGGLVLLYARWRNLLDKENP